MKDHGLAHDEDADDDVTDQLANQLSAREWKGCVCSSSLELIDAEETEEEEGAEQKVAEVGGGGGGLVRKEEQPLILSWEQGGTGPPTCSTVMDKYRPKRPTTLALFPQQPQAGSQDTINNNSLGKKDSWKDSHSSSPHITGDQTPPGAQSKAEAKVRPSTRRPAPKPPVTNGTNSRANGQPTAVATTDTRARVRERQGSTNASNQSPRSQRRGGGGAGTGGKGTGRGGLRDRNQTDSKAKDGSGKDERRGARLCEEKCRDKDKNGHSRIRETIGLRGRAEAKTKAAPKAPTKGAGSKANNMLNNHQPYLPAMVVPRTPVAPRKNDKSKEKGQNHDRKQEQPPALSRSSSEGGSNRMSLSSDTEGPPPGPLHPSLSYNPNPDISEEDGEGEPTPSKNITQNCPEENTEPKPELEPGTIEQNSTTITEDTNVVRTIPKSETTAGLNYDSVKYTLVVDENSQLELVSLKDCLHSYSEHKDDSDTETVYQSANEEEDPEYEVERKKKDEETKKQERRKEEERKRKEEEDLQRRREEEVKRRREVVATFYKHPRFRSTTTSEEDQSKEGRATAPRSKKFLNLFGGDSDYSETGASSFGMFSCVLNGVERQQSHRAVYRFVPRHADELYLETDDPVLILKQSEDLWCQGYNMRTGATGIFPAFYVVKVSKDINNAPKEGWLEQFMVRFLGSVQVPIFKGNDVLCAAMHKVACNRRQAGQPPSACVLEVSVKGVKIIVQDQCQSAHRGDQCFNFFQLKNISFCGCHPKHNRYFGFITKHPDQHRFACHVLMSDTTLHPLAECVGRAFKQYYKQNIGYSCPTEDIFIE
ncbi:C-Jun-amino-terminal kinase-interacting protein 1-like [Periophthalmus magnuspinnatus]|uniref:C-Jun-amino-terminal kinase-interacting protein 1-like n=1 Tax=Periophthalmus magnuspinnatus TaxID=409849 RepID=UPI002436B00C|nr:C-Jun-amino-terminal kinase-interacting protein 1-like [Periophthalmus magnuspinnatus]XP_033824337.2 C-Jun-amino-terminal kinase-interacting protein 1-like [Periophthalmus magnuspinnatus]